MAAQAQEAPDAEIAAPAEPAEEAVVAEPEGEAEPTSESNRASTTEPEAAATPDSHANKPSPTIHRATRDPRAERGRDASSSTRNWREQDTARRPESRRSRRGSYRRSEPVAEPEESTNSPANPSPEKSGFGTFRIIAERNIFDTTRSPHSARAPRPTSRPARVETLALVGTLSYEKGQYAFFEGSSSELTKVLTNGQRIAGYVIKDISRQGVELASGTNRISLTVGGKLRREGEKWEPTGASERPAPEATSEGHVAPAGSPGEDNDILRRLMRQRAEQLK